MTSLGRLTKVEIRSIWETEDNHFTPWLAKEENINTLAEVLNTDLEVIEVEKNVGPFRADILCKDTSTDNYVIIENQFGKTDHGHLGQVMTYASGLEAFTVVWIAERFTEEHRAALDWLNNITDEKIEFFGIEIELFKIGDSATAPSFNIISKPNSWSKSVRKNSRNFQLTDTKQQHLEFWVGFKDYVESRKLSFRLQKPQPQHWTNISIGRSNYRLSAFANSRDKRIGIQLIVLGNDALNSFRKLKAKYEEDSLIKLSKEIEWLEKDGGKEHHVNMVFFGNDPHDKTQVMSQYKLLAEWTEKFFKYFKSKVKNN